MGLFLAFLVEDNKSVCNYRIGSLHERSEVVKDFTPECGGINRGDTSRVLKAPRGVSEVDSMRGVKPLQQSGRVSVMSLLLED